MKVAPLFGNQYYKLILRYISMRVNIWVFNMPYDILFQLLIYYRKLRTWVIISMILTLQWSAMCLKTIVVLCKFANTYKFWPRTKHLNIKIHHFRDYVSRNIISIEHIKTDEQCCYYEQSCEYSCLTCLEFCDLWPLVHESFMTSQCTAISYSLSWPPWSHNLNAYLLPWL